ncbi:hypothetical protein ES703_02632 [subsurface metagenome]
MGLVLKSERAYDFSKVQGYAEDRMGPKRTIILAIGAGLGVVLAAGLIHMVRQGEGRGRS